MPAGEFRRINGKSYKASNTTYNNGDGVSQQMCEDNKDWWRSRSRKSRVVCVSGKNTPHWNKKYILYVEQ